MALIAKADIEEELQITLPAGYTDTIILNLCAQAESRLKVKTNRTSFSGEAANEAKQAALCFAIDRLTTSNRDLVKTAITNISENGNSISFSNMKTLASYREEAMQIVADLKLPGTPKLDLTFPDPDDEHTGTEGSILY